MTRRLLLPLLGALLLGAFPGQSLAQQVCYSYDSAGRLSGVVDENRNAAIYHYDAVGNILSIDRRSPTGPVTIYAVYPLSGKPGEQFEIFGVGFSATPNQNQVTVGGISATVTQTLPCTLVVDTPSNGITGQVHVTTPAGQATSDDSFLVSRFTIAGTAASVLPNILVQFTVTSNGCNDLAVVWKVNGVIGGATATGTITANGLYTAPATVPTPAYATIRADSVVCPTLFDSKALNIVTSATTYVYATVSATHGAPPPLLPSGALFATASARFGAAPIVLPANVVNTSASAANGTPIITTMSPSTRARSVNAFLFHLTGQNFAGATGLTFFNASMPDAAITVSNVTVNQDGSISATVLIPTTAAIGTRTVRVNTPGGNSTAVTTPSNTFTVTQ